jgi:glycosidase
MIESIGFGTAQVRPGTDRVQLRPGEALTVGLGVSAGTPGELDGAEAVVHTNYGLADPTTFATVPMVPVVPQDGHQHAFEATLGPARPGTYIATAFVDVGGVRHWAQDHARPDSAKDRHNLNNRLVFRVPHPDVDRLLVRQVPLDKANARSDSTDISTTDDMLETEGSWYSLARLADEGVTCVWVQVPYRLDLWDKLPAVDDAGSDYASTDWFAIDPELSRDARLVPPWDLDRQRRLSNDVMRRFVDRAHALGMRVLFEIAPNHVGHNFIFRDEFDVAGGTEVRRRDYAQMTVDADQLSLVMRRLTASDIDETIKSYAEYMFPQMYAARLPDGTYDPRGASSVQETYSPDWYGLWADTKHLNHGGHAGQHIWYPRTAQNLRVLAYIGRAMLWAASDLGADGFRLDHTLGMPYFFFEQTLPWVESRLRARRGDDDASLLLVHEDHDRKDYTARVGDVVQSKGYEGLLDALTHQDVDRVWALYDDPYLTTEFTGTGNHDEIRGSVFFGGDLLAYGNAVMTMLLMGGAMTMLAGDEFAESQQLRFKARGGIPTLWQLRTGELPAANTTLADWVARAARLRRDHPALAGVDRERLHVRDTGGTGGTGGTGSTGGGDGTDPVRKLLTCVRSVPDGTTVPLVVVNNLGRTGTMTTATYDVGARLGAWLAQTPDRFFQVRDRAGLDPQRPLWSRPVSGHTLLLEGLGIGLQPYQIQVLELERLP